MRLAQKFSAIMVIAVLLPSYHFAKERRDFSMADCTETIGHLIDWRFDSKITRAPVQYRIYLPPCYYATSKRYPYVILMSGNDGDETEWTERLNADTIADTQITLQNLPPMVLVMPNGGTLMNMNAFFPLRSWETVVTDELMPEVETTFCVQQYRDGRAIGGISRGGFWAFEIAFRHLDLFSAVGGHSPVFGQTDITPDIDPLSLATTIEPNDPLRMWLDMGDQDISLPGVEQLYETLSNRQLDVTFNISPGGDHSDNYWRSHLGNYLEFYGLNWSKNVADLPDCDK